MNSKKLFYVMLGLLGLAVLASIAGTVYGTGLLKKTGNELAGHKLEQAVLRKDEQALKVAKQEIAKYNELEQVAKSIVPQEKDQARTVRELVAIANKSGIQIESIDFPSSTLGSKPKAAKGKKAPPAGSTQLTPVEGLNGVYAMPINVQVSQTAPVTYAQLLSFLKNLENNRRTSHVTNISIQPVAENRDLINFNLQINAYIKP